MYTINSSISIKADEEPVFAVLTAYSQYPEFMHYVKKVGVEKVNENELITTWYVDVEGADVNWVEKDFIDKAKHQVVFKMLSGDYGLYSGVWSVSRLGDKTTLSVKISVDWDIPSFEKIIGVILEKKTKKIIRGMLAAIKLRTERSLSQDQVLYTLKRATRETSRKFAFVIHPLDVGLVSVAFNEPSLLHKKLALVKKAFEWLPSFQCSEVTGVISSTGISLKGDLMYFALLPEQIVSMDPKVVLERVIEAGKIAKSRGANILGLGAYAAQIGKKGAVIAKQLQMPVTTGTHYTIYTAIESTISAAKRVGIDFENCSVTIVGATGGIGKICAQYFAEKVPKLTLVARNLSKLKRIAEDITRLNGIKVNVQNNVREAVQNADISIMATTTPVPLVDLADLRSGSLVCDISRPRNVSNVNNLERKDVLVIDGGIVRPPGKDVNFNFYFGLDKALAYACMAETMILALEGKFESYSIGGDLSFDKVKEIGLLGKKHGFQLAKVISFDKEVSEDWFEKVLNANKAYNRTYSKS